MTKRTLITLAALATTLLLGRPVYGLDQDKVIDMAMHALKSGDRETASDILEAALAKEPDAPRLNYHAGLVHYDNSEFDLAKDRFSRALHQQDKTSEAAANYNTGNSLFKEAEGLRTTDPKQAITLMKEALQYYARAIELNNADKDASYNYELTDKVIKLIKLQQPPPTAMPQSGKNKKEEEGEDKQQQQQQKQQQKQDQQEQEEDEEKKEEQQRAAQKQSDEKQQEKEEEPSGSEPDEKEGPEEEQDSPQNEGELSEEEARMLVETYGQEGPRLDINKDKKAKDAKVIKNW